MDRRAFFQEFNHLGKRATSPVVLDLEVQGGIEPYESVLTRQDVYHLLRRMGFGPSHARVATLVGKTAGEAVDILLAKDQVDVSAVPGPWVDSITEDPMGADLQTRFSIWGTWRRNMDMLATWWLDRMAADGTAAEKTTLFWTSHFAVEFSFDETFTPPPMLYRMYKMLYRDRLGMFKDLALDVTLDNSMLNYLGGTLNKVGKPNENYGRELMELYTTGIGHYTEGDVKEAARVLTGWKSNRYNDEPMPNGAFESFFWAADHDIGAKTIMGRDIPARTVDNNTAFQVRNEEIKGLIDIIHTQRPEAVSRFIAGKAYRFFIYSSPHAIDQTYLEALAKVFRESDFNLHTMFRTMFTSAHFFDPAIRGCQIKTPIEYVAGLMHQLGVSIKDSAKWTAQMDQEVMDPPNVAAWPGYRAWMSTNTYPVRRSVSQLIIDEVSDAGLYTFMQSFDGFANVRDFVSNVVDYFLPMPVSASRMDNYVSALLGTGTPEYEWPAISSGAATASPRMRQLLKHLTKAPDFQLC